MHGEHVRQVEDRKVGDRARLFKTALGIAGDDVVMPHQHGVAAGGADRLPFLDVAEIEEILPARRSEDETVERLAALGIGPRQRDDKIGHQEIFL